MAKDFYQILGITEEEKKLPQDKFQDVVKKKYRKLAVEWHPDKFAAKSEAERKEAEQKMQEINEANETLSDANKRAAYDNQGNPFGGFGGFGVFGGFDPFDPFNSVNHQQREMKGGSVKIHLNVTLDDLMKETYKTIKYTRYTSGGVCMHCGGTGMTMKQRGSGMFMSRIMSTCPYCKGSGCEQTELNETIDIRLDGVDNTYEVGYNPTTNILSFLHVEPKRGNKVSDDINQNGDLIIVVDCKLPQGFYIVDDTLDIYTDVNVNVLDALLGGTKDIQGVDGKTWKITIPSNVSEGYKLRLGNCGLSMGNKQYTNLICNLKIKFPTKLTDEERKLLETLKTHPNFQ